MSAAQPYSDVPLDPAGGIAIAMRCRICGYNLRSQSLTGVCPECGTPVYETARSFRADDLVYADPNWLEKVLLGARLLVAALLISLGTSLAGGFLGVFLRIAAAPPTAFIVLQWGVNLLVMALWIIGLLYLTRRSPHAVERRLSARRAVRQLLLLLTVVWIGAIAAATVFAIQAFANTNNLSPFPEAYFAAMMGLSVAGMIVGALLAAAMLRHIRNLMVAAGATGAARYASFLFWIQWPIALALTGGVVAVSLPFSGFLRGPIASSTPTTPPKTITLPANIPTNGVYTISQMGPTQFTYYSFIPPAGSAAQFAPGTPVTVIDTSGQVTAPTVSVSITTGDDDSNDTDVKSTAPLVTKITTPATPASAPSGTVTFTSTITPGGQGTMAGTPGAVSLIVDTTVSPTLSTTGLLVGSVLLALGVFAALGFVICAMILVFVAAGKLSAAAREARLNWVENSGHLAVARPVVQ